jgi:hypothetical protein
MNRSGTSIEVLRLGEDTRGEVLAGGKAVAAAPASLQHGFALDPGEFPLAAARRASGTPPGNQSVVAPSAELLGQRETVR